MFAASAPGAQSLPKQNRTGSRALSPDPFANAAERMFEYYHDLKDLEAEAQDTDANVSSETANGDATFTRSRSAASASTRALKW